MDQPRPPVDFNRQDSKNKLVHDDVKDVTSAAIVSPNTKLPSADSLKSSFDETICSATEHSSFEENPESTTSEGTTSTLYTFLNSSITLKSLPTNETVTTLDTLSMINTPWSTESWVSQSLADATTYSSSMFSWTNSENISYTLTSTIPRSTTSYGPPSPSRNTGSNTTLTLLDRYSSTASPSIQLFPKRDTDNDVSDTQSSWTMESFTSNNFSSDPGVIKVNYPWSPCTILSSTNIYPTSVTGSVRSSRVSSLTPGSLVNEKEKKDPMTAMNYFLLSTQQENNAALDWCLIKQNIPIGDGPKVI